MMSGERKKGGALLCLPLEGGGPLAVEGVFIVPQDKPRVTFVYSLSLAMLDSSLGEGAYRGPLAVEGVSLPPS